ncbi:CD63 antigen-like, partial [Anoplophora glabripennis]|uniref:CD63 antigen-like n=1 Tax=Anoplophora glabripennis TaxID=217634 RepID=UPI0008755728
VLMEDDPLDLRAQMWFMHDGAPPHFSGSEEEERCSCRIAPQVPRLNAVRFLLWKSLKNKVYATPVESQEELLRRIQNEADISGIAIIAAGAIVLANASEFNHFADNGLIGPPIVFIVAGAIVFIIAFLGCFGAIKESYNMLMAFAGLLLIIFIIELAVGIAAAVYKADFHNALNSTLRKSMQNYSSDSEMIAWNNLQKKFECCGVDGPSDWEAHGHSLPFSCCNVIEGGNEKIEMYCINNGVGKYLFQDGCYQKLQNQINSNAKILIGVGIGIAFIEVVGIVLACWLAHTIKREDTSK